MVEGTCHLRNVADALCVVRKWARISDPGSMVFGNRESRRDQLLARLRRASNFFFLISIRGDTESPSFLH